MQKSKLSREVTNYKQNERKILKSEEENNAGDQQCRDSEEWTTPPLLIDATRRNARVNLKFNVVWAWLALLAFSH